MASFEYTAIGADGARVTGVLAGANEAAVLSALEEKRLTPVRIRAAKQRRTLSRGIGSRRLGAAYTQLADLLRAGVPLMRGLRLLGGQKSNPRLSQVFREIGDAVAEGEDLADAMSGRPEFGPVHVAMVRAGEKGGFLEQVLARLGSFLRAQADLKAKIIGNLIYPIVLIVVGIVVLLVIFGVFVPKFRPLFDSLPSLPTLTVTVLAIGDLVAALWWVAPAALVPIAAAARSLLAMPNVKRATLRFAMRVPALGSLLRAIAVGRFTRILGTMLDNAIPMLSAMQIARDAAGNVLMEEAVDEAIEAVRGGESLVPPLAKSGLFDDDVLEMIIVGESANNLGEVLTNIAETLESRIDRQLAVVVKLIEPVILLLLAGVIAAMAFALIIPMSRLSQAAEM